jgi:hypothetical protein
MDQIEVEIRKVAAYFVFSSLPEMRSIATAGPDALIKNSANPPFSATVGRLSVPSLRRRAHSGTVGEDRKGTKDWSPEWGRREREDRVGH